MPVAKGANSDTTLDQHEQLITDLSQRLSFLERVLTKMAESNPAFGADFGRAGHSVALEKAEVAGEMLRQQRDRLVEIKAPDVIIQSKSGQVELASNLQKELAAQDADDWAEQHIDLVAYRERVLIHNSSTGGIFVGVDGLLEIALGLVDARKIAQID